MDRMTTEQIKEYNTLCVEFLGWEYHKGHFINALGGTPLTLKEDELCFHEDWNWIMSVLDKIESLEFVSTAFYVDISDRDDGYKGFVFINHEICIGELGTSKKNAYVKAIYEFLKWYKTK